jgi:alpha-L-fucosidase
VYDGIFKTQLRELLTNYGEVCEVWFDGAQPGNRFQAHDFSGYYRLIRELQPNACIAGRGPDIRWVGNENGFARPSEWSVVGLPMDSTKFTWPDMTDADLGSRGRLQASPNLHWYPAVADVPVRGSWFWAPNRERQLKSLGELELIYRRSVGRNAGLLLNLSPNNDGLIPADDSARLREFGAVVTRYRTNQLPDSAQWSLDTASSSDGRHVFVIRLKEPIRFDTVSLSEDITRGQRVESWQIFLPGMGTTPWAAGTTIGYKVLASGPAQYVNEIRLSITQSRGVPFPHLPAAHLSQQT